jgi:hypothetical protein
MTTLNPKKPTDWRKRFHDKKQDKVVALEIDFAGIKSGSKMYIATPGIIANYIKHIPVGETRSIERMRNELARQHGATATCPVTTAIFLRVVCEAMWDDYEEKTPVEKLVPFWRVVEPGSTIAKKLRCDSQWLEQMREAETK